MRVDLGTTDRAEAGFDRYVDIVLNPNIAKEKFVKADLSMAFPFEDSSVDFFRANDIIEHLPDRIHTMNELWRCLKNGGRVEIAVPCFPSVGAVCDPQHISYWTRHTFDYFVAGTNEYRRFWKHYGIKGSFKIVSERKEVFHKNYPSGKEEIVKLTIILEAIKRNAPQAQPKPAAPPARKPAPPPKPKKSPKCLLVMRIKDEERWIKESIEASMQVCDRAVIFDDCSMDKTRQIVRAIKGPIELIESPFRGLNEVRDKNWILKERILPLDPEFVLWIDGDEVLTKAAIRWVRQRLTHPDATPSWYFRFAYLWDNPARMRVDGVYGKMWSIRFWRLRGQPKARLVFKSPFGKGFHCGSSPVGLVGRPGRVPSRVLIKHYGYMSETDRKRKHQFYVVNDPNNAAEDHYRHLIGRGRHAPTPPVVQVFRDE